MKNGTIPCAVPETAFGSLSRSLATICQEHYASLDEAELRKSYRVTQDLPQRAQTEQPRDNSSAVQSEFDAVMASLYGPGQYNSQQSQPQVTNQAAPATPKQHSTKTRKLDDHDAFINAFITAIRSPDWSLGDKRPVDAFKSINWAAIAGRTDGNTPTGSKRRTRGDAVDAGENTDRGSLLSIESNGSVHKKVKGLMGPPAQVSHEHRTRSITRAKSSGSGTTS